MAQQQPNGKTTTLPGGDNGKKTTNSRDIVVLSLKKKKKNLKGTTGDKAGAKTDPNAGGLLQSLNIIEQLTILNNL